MTKEYILGLLTTLKLTEKDINSLEKEAERINSLLAKLREEERSLKTEIESIHKQLPGLAARERNIDPELLERELLSILGRSKEEIGEDRAFRELERDSAVDAELKALKIKMGKNYQQEKTP